MDRATLLELDGMTRRTERIFRVPTGARLEARAATDTSPASFRFEGIACVTGHWYEMYGGPPYGWDEMVAPNAFRKTLSENADVQLLINHGGLPLARTKSGTLDLSEVDQGLLAVAPELLAVDPDVQRIAPKMDRGDLDEMSMGFWIIRQRWEDENGDEADPAIAPRRRILEVSLHKGDVSIVNYGANDATWGTLRDVDRALVELRAGRDLDPTARAALARLAATIVDDENRSSDAPDEDAPEGMSVAFARALIERDRTAA